ncbi:diterpenoid dioxygenase domain protein [Mycobacterium ulcerans str. Harvey]|uniref:Diterpenoid dioxygenase domain protein n=1 Tax=Mycobacterium ulcerans str. Harvey TaxID=1299332 RepID=A0ABN0QTK4_MYCUL|nr:diterpenoid dioxygenase domain protein [Mycobacterium ulcerans str. Harvey]
MATGHCMKAAYSCAGMRAAAGAAPPRGRGGFCGRRTDCRMHVVDVLNQLVGWGS